MNLIENSQIAYDQFLHESMRSSKIGVRVTFTKKDSTRREMFCTLNEELIPENKRPKSTNSSTVGSAVRVFDIEEQEWRSFRWDSVIVIETYED